MGRIRSIKPDFGAVESLSGLPAETHLLAALLHPYADDEGYFNANPKLVQGACVPLREDSVNIHEQLNQLEKVGYIERRRCVGGKTLGRVVSFSEDQRVNRPTPSKLRELWNKREDSPRPHTQLTDDSLAEGKGREGIGMERKGGEEAPPVSSETDELEDTHADEIADAENNHGQGELEPNEADCAREMFETLGIPVPPGTLKLAAEAIRLKAKQLATTPRKAMLLIQRRAELARADGETVNRFWFEDCKFDSKLPIATAVKPESIAEEEAPAGMDTSSAERLWEPVRKGAAKEINRQSFETWVQPLKPLGVLDGVFYLRSPSPDFSHVSDRYAEVFAKFLPASVETVKLLSAGVA